VSSAPRPDIFGAIPATKDDSLPTDLQAETRFNGPLKLNLKKGMQ
jgi:hypothetical protein